MTIQQNIDDTEEFQGPYTETNSGEERRNRTLRITKGALSRPPCSLYNLHTESADKLSISLVQSINMIQTKLLFTFYVRERGNEQRAKSQKNT